MELLYIVNKKQNNSNNNNQIKQFESLTNSVSLCSISNQNILVFTTCTTLHDSSANSWGSHVYVADLNTPWQAHRVMSNRCTITVVEWDLNGGNLLVADCIGTVQIWCMKDHILNDWVCLGSATFQGENILSAVFFHNGRKVSLISEKKDSSQYSEKFSHMRVAPSVRHFGGRPLEGCLVVSATGMVGVIVVCAQSNGNLVSVSESLGSMRNRITSVDICYGKNGHFLVAASSGNVKLPIQCYRVSVKKLDDKCVITSQALPSFFLQNQNLQNLPTKEAKSRRVVELKFVVREDTDSLVVAANGETDSVVEIWELREQPLTVHKLFQGRHTPTPAPSPDPIKTIVWQHQSQYHTNSHVVTVTTSKLNMSTSVPPASYIVVALSDGSVNCLHRESLRQVVSANLNSLRTEDGPMTKQPRYSTKLSKMDLSWLGNVLLCTDTQGQLYLFRLMPVAEPGSSLTVPSACALLEYCLVTGIDWWDLLISLRPAMLEPICDRLTDSFSRQNTATRQFYYVQFLAIKTSLYRMCAGGQSKGADLTSLLMLYSIGTAFKTLLRPSDMSNHDKGPADSLATVMSDPVADVDKVLLHLEAKEFTVEPSTLQSLQQLIQWVADLCVNLLAKLTQQQLTQPARTTKPSGPSWVTTDPGLVSRVMELDIPPDVSYVASTDIISGIANCANNDHSGYGRNVWRDPQALNTLRELLVIIRIWGLLRQSCLPVFVRSVDNLDVLALLFRLLSRLIQTSETDETLLDECCQLSNQVVIPNINHTQAATHIASCSLFMQSLPIQLEFGVEPACLEFQHDFGQTEHVSQAEQMLDSFRHVYLGKQPLLVKECTRCGSKAQVTSSSRRTAAIIAWDQRWFRSCRCGGHWRIRRYETSATVNTNLNISNFIF